MGGIVLFIKGYSLLKEANKLTENFAIIIIVLILAFIVGLIKNKYIMSIFCIKNLRRISKINSPKVYQFFSSGFFFALAIMILAGITLSRLASGNYGFMLAVGGLDLALATALITSSAIFFREKF
jgi:hypothetical protein